MPKNDYINAVLSYIERHLTEALTPENIARRHFVSVSQLYRDFYDCTGHSIKEYIRKRRISNACEKIKCSALSLTVIADESGYQTIQSFHKIFKRTVGMTPMEYRMNDSYFYFYPFATYERGVAVKVGMESIPAYTTTRFYSSCQVGIEDNAIKALGLGNISGRVFGRNGKQMGNRFCYEVMTEIPGEIRTSLYATCVVNYDDADISNGWNYLYNNWLSASMFEESGEGIFEEYFFQNGKPRKLKLYLPVKKRKVEQHITITAEPEKTFIIAKEKGYNAERKASEMVMAFLQQHPLLIRNAQRFYVCTYNGVYECGVECDSDFWLTTPLKQRMSCGIDLIHMPAGRYAVLSGNCYGDTRVVREKMDSWLQNNGIPHENEPAFAIYEITDGSYDAENICMKLYKRLKDDKNG
ncbi:helix-turn-helix domain-containing protein [Bianquea renquensis]|jgi:transcriptional regulator, araC family|uniref:Helix-turn-helix domain-containing protein n=1 Tax=Bianquea renquensis TaxID=2763661 RepID=A0A926DTH3_9FIRM|nr:helix-turn-helix domain-containing protein [Bianquea renquensis]MBC8543059.1 helix-turn-helix domain-containing protein [Bianquea renquensis]